MPDWAQFRQAISDGLPNAGRLAMLRQLDGWLDRGPAAAISALEEELKTTGAAPLYQSLVILNLTLQREAGILPGPQAAAALTAWFQAAQQAAAPEEQKRAAARLSVLWQLGGVLLQKDPALAQGPSPADIAKAKLQQTAVGIFRRLDAVSGQTTPGMVSDGSIATIQEILSDAQALIGATAPDNGGLPYLYSMTGSTARMLARSFANSGRNPDALEAYASAAEYFEKAGEPQESQDCRSRGRDLEQQLSGNLDAAAAQPLAALSVSGPQDPWEQAGARLKLAAVADSAGDVFEALQNAEAAAALLVALKYADPGVSGAEAAIDSWIAAAGADRKGVALLARLSQAGAWYDSILGARFADRIRKNPAEADALLALQAAVQQLNRRVQQEAQLAQSESTREFERYFPPPPDAAPPPEASSGPDSDALLDRMRAVDAALGKIRETCNQRAAAGAGMDDLLQEVGTLEAESDTFNSPTYQARTRLERAYILLQAGRGAELGPVARDARQRLLAGRPASLSSFAQTYDRYLYLDSLKREVMAGIMTGDLSGALGICQGTIRDFETERYRVSSEYRQAALLGWVADFYTWAAFAAFKLERWDDMLEAIDLMKARSALQGRLTPERPAAASQEQLREFEAVSDALERTPADPALRTRRRELWDLMSISRGHNGAAGAIPPLTVAAVQAALAPDEALIGYFWLNESVLLAVAVDSDRFHAQRIVLQPAELASLREFVTFLQGLRSSHNMDRAVARLGELLLPGFLRDFLQSKKRLIISPHHSLHLFPFHAAQWGPGTFVGTAFAVRYTPNFCSVLIPWSEPVENRVLAVGIRQFADPAAQPLENVEEDAAAVAESYRASGAAVETLLGGQATRERVEALRQQGALDKFRCVHLGTHGLSVFETPDEPLESRLLLQDGTLDAMDLANLRLRAELVMLCACHSGQRAIELRDLGVVPGDDIFGLQAALFRSGVRSIVGTLWLVETNSASPITRAFHRRYAAGEPVEVALQHAVGEYLASAPPARRGVYYWAPYFIASIGRVQALKGNP